MAGPYAPLPNTTLPMAGFDQTPLGQKAIQQRARFAGPQAAPKASFYGDRSVGQVAPQTTGQRVQAGSPVGNMELYRHVTGLYNRRGGQEEARALQGHSLLPNFQVGTDRAAAQTDQFRTNFRQAANLAMNPPPMKPYKPGGASPFVAKVTAMQGENARLHPAQSPAMIPNPDAARVGAQPGPPPVPPRGPLVAALQGGGAPPNGEQQRLGPPPGMNNDGTKMPLDPHISGVNRSPFRAMQAAHQKAAPVKPGGELVAALPDVAQGAEMARRAAWAKGPEFGLAFDRDAEKHQSDIELQRKQAEKHQSDIAFQNKQAAGLLTPEQVAEQIKVAIAKQQAETDKTRNETNNTPNLDQMIEMKLREQGVPEDQIQTRKAAMLNRQGTGGPQPIDPKLIPSLFADGASLAQVYKALRVGGHDLENPESPIVKALLPAIQANYGTQLPAQLGRQDGSEVAAYMNAFNPFRLVTGDVGGDLKPRVAPLAKALASIDPFLARTGPPKPDMSVPLAAIARQIQELRQPQTDEHNAAAEWYKRISTKAPKPSPNQMQVAGQN